jgi:hypothetical protein
MAPDRAQGYGFSKSDTSSIPVFLPGEMLLIQAEAYTREGDFVKGKEFLDRVLTKKASEDIFGVGADLPPHTFTDSTALMNEIYRNRCMELFMSGLKLEDARRFRRPVPPTPNSETNRVFYPYPFQERFGNSKNTPPDPPF